MGYKNAPFHNEWYKFLQFDFSPLKAYPLLRKKFLLLWPRGHAKTESTSMNYVSWIIGKYPDIHINLVTKTSTLAEQILTALITRFEIDERYIEIFGNVKPAHPRKWTGSEIIVARDEISKNPTIKATGLMGAITGGRSDLVICDDIIDEENVRTRLQLEKVSTWFNKVLIPTLYPWGAIGVIGTRWSYADIYAELLEKWPHDVKQAIQKDGTALWPEYWSLERLKERRDEIGSVFFDCQYQNDPTGMTGSLLKAEWLHSWSQLPSNLIKYAGVDPALGEGDLQAIATLGYDRIRRQSYLIDVWAEKIPFPDFIVKLRQMHIVHKYAKIYLETNAFQKVLMHIPDLKGLPIVESKTDTDKERRFIGMSAHYQSSRVLVNPLINSHRHEFYNEWVQFPRGQYDDALDCAEIVTRNVITIKPRDAWMFG